MFINHQFGNKSIPLITDWATYCSAISDQLDVLSSLQESDYYKFISDISSLYKSKLLLLNQLVQKLNEVQRKWLYLEPVYRGGAMTLKKDRFDVVDVAFQSIIGKIQANPKLKNLVDEDFYPKLPETFGKLTQDLNECQQCLAEFLEGKRFSFPRLYFLGDESLLEMLGHFKQRKALQSHLKHLFQAIHSVVFDDEMNHIIAFKSAYNEEVTLQQVCSNISIFLPLMRSFWLKLSVVLYSYPFF